MIKLKQIVKKIFWILYVLTLVIIGLHLFFLEQLKSWANLTHTPIPSPSKVETLNIVYSFSPKSLNPTLFDNITRSRLVDVYEGLVRTDRNLRIKPAIAVSWGLINPTTWEFKIRKNVKFHNNKDLGMADIVSSLKYASTNKTSQLTNLLNTISDFQIIDDTTLHIKTFAPDPLLLNKLAITYIFPENYTDFEKPLGTGPYSFETKTENTMTLKSFDGYWGSSPIYSKVILKTIRDKNERINSLKTDQLTLLGDVPPESVNTINSDKNTIKSIPSLETTFLMFNLKDPFLKNKEIRKVISYAIDRKYFVDIAAGFAHPINQFISTGVFGFNPNIKQPTYQLEEAKMKMNELTANVFERISIEFDYPKGLDPVAQYLQHQFEELGLELKLNPLEIQELEQKIAKGNSRFYYLGWKSELGDANDFLNTIVHSHTKDNAYGMLNGTHYINPEVDILIEQTTQDLNSKTRLENLQKIMKTIVEDDVIGIPLFETETIFAFNKNLQFEPRVDSYIYASEIK